MPALKNKRHERFCQEYIVDENGTQAAIRAKYSAKTAAQQAYDLLRKPEIDIRIQELRQERSKRLQMTADDVLRHWRDIAMADPNELVQHRQGACRYCWGVDHEYQWKTHREYRAACGEDELAQEFDPPGGFGYRLSDPPNPECPECSGIGNTYVVPMDTRNLSPQARLLFAGVKQTKDGLEIKLRDQDKALENVARANGMFKDKVEHSGNIGYTIQTAVPRDPGDEGDDGE